MPLPDNIVIRGAEPDDFAAIVAIGNQRSVAAGTLGLLFQTPADARERFQLDATHRMLVAEVDGRVVGNSGLVLYRNRRAHVGAIGMSVDEAFQGRGVGTA